MNTRAITMTIAFAVLTNVLNPAISGVAVPFPLIPTLLYNIWEIVIIVAFLLMGFKSGISVALLNSAFLFAVYPGPAHSIYALGNSVAVSAMMVGVYLASKFTRRGSQAEVASGVKTVTLSTVFAMLLRVVVMAPIMYAILHYNIVFVPAGVTESVIITVVLPLQAIYNVTIALYTIPLGYLIAKVVGRNLKVATKI
jgi:riboflavin transporter FmnP